MLRVLHGEPRRKDEGLLLHANQAIQGFIRQLARASGGSPSKNIQRLRIWSESLLRSLDELEQSEYAATLYSRKVAGIKYVDELTEEQEDDYHRHLYYYKNALIRLFAVLDKLGHFMNEKLELKTERIKARFSYFTVLRNMHQQRLHTALEQQLYDLKIKYQEPVSRLRNERNMEIHTINADLLDDLLKAAELRRGESVRVELEDVRNNLHQLRQGTEMVYRAAAIVFRYLQRG